MTTSLQSLQHIGSVLLVKWIIPEYRTSLNEFPTVLTLRYTDSLYDIVTSNDGTYLANGPLISVSNNSEAIRSPKGTFTIGISGIPVDELQPLLISKIKGSSIYVYRQFVYPDTGLPISDLDFARSSGGIVGRLSGFVETYSIEDSIDNDTQVNTIDFILDCSNFTSITDKMVKGIRTNPKDLAFISSNPNEKGFDKVPTLYQKEFWFGKKQ